MSNLLEGLRNILNGVNSDMTQEPNDPNYFVDTMGTQYRHFNSPVGPINIANLARPQIKGGPSALKSAAPPQPAPSPTSSSTDFIPFHQATQHLQTPSPTASPDFIPFDQATKMIQQPSPSSDLTGGGSFGASPSPSPTPTQGPISMLMNKNGNLGSFMKSLAQQESGGDYSARNKDSGAIGKYQIMPSNWSAWAQEAGLPADAKPTPANQELIAHTHLANLYHQYGNWGDVASVWYSGHPLNQVNPNAPQGSYPSIGGYVKSVLGRLGM